MSPGPTPASHSPLKVGDKLGKYDIVGQIGAGGSAIVWKGHDKLLDKYAAIKQLMPPESEWENARERFIQEAETLKRVSRNSKHIVQILDTVSESRGMFIIMEYIEGQTLEQLLATKPDPISERQALGIVGGIALALEAIHSAGVVHRDIKPSNILLPKSGGLKVVDFGVSTLVETPENMTAGTVRYMAPELFSEGKPDGRADLYSLGFIAYEMLAGRGKFEEAFRIIMKDQRNAAQRWMKWHMNPRVKATALNQLNPAISQTLSDLVMRMMEKDATQRLSSPAELLAAIRRHFSGESAPQPTQNPAPEAATPAATVATGEATAPIPKRSKLPLILGGALAAVTIFGFGGIFAFKYAQENNQRQKGIDPATARKMDEDTFRGLRTRFESLDKQLAEYNKRTDNDPAARQKIVDEYRALSESFQELADRWPGDGGLGKPSEARSQIALAKAELESGNYQDAMAALDKADAVGISSNRDQIEMLMAEARRRSSFQTVINEIRDMIGRQEFAQARNLITEQRRRTLSPGETRLLDDVSTRLEDQLYQSQITRIISSAKAKADAGNRAEAINDLALAKRTYKNHAIDQYLDQLLKEREIASLKEAASASEARGDWTKAVEQLTKLQTLQPDQAIAEKLLVYRSRLAIEEARRLRSQGQLAAAAEKFREAINIRPSDEAKRELDDILKTTDREKLVQTGRDAMARKDYDAAIKAFQNALQIREEEDLRKAIRTMQVETLQNAAIAQLQQGKLETARASLDQADQISPGNSLSIRIRESINRRSDYERFRDAGDKFRAESNFIDAKSSYIRAREVIKDMNVPEAKREIETRLDDVEFDHLMAQARSQMNSLNWDSAKALLGAAYAKRATPDVAELLAKVNERIKDRDAAREQSR